jgi:rhodanese-related sulfurtransferase
MILLVLVTASQCWAADRNYVDADTFKSWLESGKEMVVVDIQEVEAFAKQHFAGSIETNAYPVKSDAERHRIDPAVDAAKKTGHDVVVVCPRGGGGAKRCYDYIEEQGVAADKLYILKGGVDKFPFKGLLQAKK